MPPLEREELTRMSGNELTELIDSYQKFDSKYNVYKIIALVISVFGSVFGAAYYVGGKIEGYNGFRTETTEFIKSQQKLNKNQDDVNIKILNYLDRDLETKEGRKRYLNSIKIKQNESN